MIEAMKGELSVLARPVLAWLQGRGADFAWDLLAAAVILAAGAVAIRMMSRALRKVVDRKIGERELLERFVTSVVVKCAWALLFIVVLGQLGVSVAPLIAGLGVTGVVLGFAFQESLGSLAAGIMLAFNQPFKLGDYVVVGGHEGTVKQLDMMAVVLETGDCRLITIPNKQAWGSPIVNYSALKVRRVDIPLGVAYGSDLTRARELARRVLASIPAVLKDPAPMCEVKSLDASAVVLTCRAWVGGKDYWPTCFAANQLLLDEFMKAGFSIPFPQLDVHVVEPGCRSRSSAFLDATAL